MDNIYLNELVKQAGKPRNKQSSGPVKAPVTVNYGTGSQPTIKLGQGGTAPTGFTVPSRQVPGTTYNPLPLTSPSSIHVSATPTASVAGSAATGAGNSQRVMNLVDQAKDLYHTATTSPMGRRVIKAGKDLAGGTVGLTAAGIAGKYAPVAKQTAEHVFDNLVERVAPGMTPKSLDPAALGDKIISAIDNATAHKVIPPAPPVPKGMSLPAKLALGAATLGTTGLLGYGATRGYVNMNKEAFAKSLLEQGYSVEDTLALVKEAEDRVTYGDAFNAMGRAQLEGLGAGLLGGAAGAGLGSVAGPQGALVGSLIGGSLGGAIGGYHGSYASGSNTYRRLGEKPLKAGEFGNAILRSGVEGGLAGGLASAAAKGMHLNPVAKSILSTGAGIAGSLHGYKASLNNSLEDRADLRKEAFAKSLLEQGYSVEDTLALVKEASLLGKIKELPERYARGALFTAAAPLTIPAAHFADLARAVRRARGGGREGEDVAKYTNALVGDMKTFIGGTGALAATGYAAKKLLDRAAAKKASKVAVESIKQEAASGMSNADKALLGAAGSIGAGTSLI
jgi:hypothetical protein